MKTKITVIIIETPPYNRSMVPEIRLVVNKDNEFPNKYITTKSIDETLFDICSSCINVNCAWLNPQLTELVNEGNGVVEAIYTAVLERGTAVCRNDHELIELNKLELKEKYAKSITSTPRSV
tara:strand:- start:115 stop:480 length:366 start_codon:yes stop_codon:yes gene_type:complete